MLILPKLTFYRPEFNLVFRVMANVEVLVLFFVWTIFFFLMVSEKNMVSSDFLSFYTVGKMVRQGEAPNIYDINIQESYQSEIIGMVSKNYLPFRFPPFAILIFYPFSFLSFPEAYWVFLSLNVLLIFIILAIIKKTFRNISNFRLWPLLPFSYYPVILSLVKGQTSILFMFIILMMFGLLKPKPFLAGFIYSILLIKPHFFIFGLPFFLMAASNKKRFFLGLAIFSLFLLLVSSYLVGFKTLSSYPSYIFTTESYIYHFLPDAVVNMDLFSLTSLLKIYYENEIFGFIVSLIIYISTLFLFAKRLMYVNFRHLYFVAVIFLTLFSFRTYPYDFSLIFIPIVILIDDLLVKNKPNLILCLLVPVLLILPNIQINGSFFLNSLVLFCTGILFLIRKANLLQSRSLSLKRDF